MNQDEWKTFETASLEALASFNVLFEMVTPEKPTKKQLISTGHADFLLLLRAFFRTLLCESGHHKAENGMDANRAAVADILNVIVEKTKIEPFHHQLDSALLEAIVKKSGSVSRELLKDENSDLHFFLRHAIRLATILQTLIPNYCDAARNENNTEKIRPSAPHHLNTANSIFLRLKEPALILELRKKSDRMAMFKSGQVYRCLNGKFIPLELKGIRKADEFYGYHEARRIFLEHFAAFSNGKSNFPLLITSLPGLGKTQMTISHTLVYPDIILIIPEPRDIEEGLETLIAKLSEFPDYKFMIFFDDIDNHKTNWYYFRANVGGTFNLPPNIAITIASNHEFPANISSRGRGFTFPTFDEIRCQEMVEDFLVSKGMRNPTPELVSVIASDYVEEFGQKKFEELSPRTLVRYLNIYYSDQNKCRHMLELSRQDVITRPDAQVFYEENIKLLRSIYGNEAIEELKRKELDGE